MGCDIHILAQRRDKGKDFWYAVSEIYLPRNYTLFGLMGLEHRSEVKPIIPLRGRPEDDALRSLYDIGGDHSFSWCTYQEFLSVAKEFANLEPNSYESFKPYLYLVMDTLKSLMYGKGEARLVYGFDS